MPDASTLVKLADTDLATRSPDEDVRGRKVIDRHGDEVGEVKDLLVDENSQDPRVRFLEVGAGGILGIGEQTLLVPVGAVAGVGPEEVRIDRTRDSLREAPRYDPDLVRREGYYDGVYSWWGYQPHWMTGYVYPPYPVAGMAPPAGITQVTPPKTERNDSTQDRRE